MTPSNSIFRGLYKLCKELHPHTTDYIDETSDIHKLPVIYIGEGDESEGSGKELVGTVGQTVHIYGTRVQRQEVDELTGRIRNQVKQGIPEYGYRITSPRVTITTLHDNSTGQVLLHKIIDIRVTYYKK